MFLEDRGGAGGEGADAPLWLVRHAHANMEDYQELEVSEVWQEHADTVSEEVLCDRKTMHECVF